MLHLLLLNTADVVASLNIFWKGMLAIAVVMALIIGVTAAMNAIDRNAQRKKKEREAQEQAENGENQAE